MPRTLMIMAAASLLMATAGCNSNDARLDRLARESAAQQAAQNEAFARLSRETTESHQQMLSRIEQSRQELIGLSAEVTQQQSDLTQERRDLANERHRESLLAPVIYTVGSLCLACLPLVLAWQLLVGLKASDPDESEVTDLLVRDLTSQQPLLLPEPLERAATGRPRALPEPEEKGAEL